ncbi:3'-5' exonuclease [Aquaspirillum soli]
MFKALQQQWAKRKLRDPRWEVLFQANDEEWVSVDCETTSLNVAEAEILSIGAVKVRGNRILSSESFYRVVKPSINPDAASVSIHGLRPLDVSQGISCEQAVTELLEFIGGRGLLGYYLEYDVAILNKTVKPLTGCKLPQRQVEISALYYDWKIQQNVGANIDLRLQTILDELHIPTLARHDALNDAITAAMIYQAMQVRKPKRPFG